MKLSEYLNSGKVMAKTATLLVDINLDNGESRKKGDKVSVLMQLNDGTYHIEDNDFACNVNANEIEIINE